MYLHNPYKCGRVMVLDKSNFSLRIRVISLVIKRKGTLPQRGSKFCMAKTRASGVLCILTFYLDVVQITNVKNSLQNNV